MIGDKIKVLIVDDEAQIRDLLGDALTKSGLQVATAESGREALRLLQAESFEVVVLDLKMPGMDGVEVLKTLKGSEIEAEVVILTGYPDVDSAIATLKLGAYDYLRKPFDVAEVVQVIRKVAASCRLKRQAVAPRTSRNSRVFEVPVLIGVDPTLIAVRTMIERAARHDASVLVTGESGTGKELVARLIHAHSARAAGPFVVVDCPSVAVSLFESELFGHERGAFTGAVSRRQGKLEQANGGTLLFDEVGDLSPEVQGKLLRFLQERWVTPVGGNRRVHVDTRVVAATNRNLAALMDQGTFRLDLFHRLNVIQIHLPPLRERRGDIPVLVAHFMGEYCRGLGIPGKIISPEALAFLVAYDWPGNVRELENAVQRAAIQTPGRTITPESLSHSILDAGTSTERGDTRGSRSLAEVDREYVLQVLRQEHWNISRAAQVLGMHRVTLYRKIMALGLRPEPFREMGEG